jgi:hypothetical protein
LSSCVPVERGDAREGKGGGCERRNVGFVGRIAGSLLDECQSVQVLAADDACERTSAAAAVATPGELRVSMTVSVCFPLLEEAAGGAGLGCADGVAETI